MIKAAGTISKGSWQVGELEIPYTVEIVVKVSTQTESLAQIAGLTKTELNNLVQQEAVVLVEKGC